MIHVLCIACSYIMYMYMYTELDSVTILMICSVGVFQELYMYILKG